MKKIQRQLVLSTITPPSAGPAIEPTANVTATRPCQRPRARGGTIRPIVACVSANSPPAPTPWTARNTISSTIPQASPQRTDPSRKIPIATTNSGLEP